MGKRLEKVTGWHKQLWGCSIVWPSPPAPGWSPLHEELCAMVPIGCPALPFSNDVTLTASLWCPLDSEGQVSHNQGGNRPKRITNLSEVAHRHSHLLILGPGSSQSVYASQSHSPGLKDGEPPEGHVDRGGKCVGAAPWLCNGADASLPGPWLLHLYHQRTELSDIWGSFWLWNSMD